MMFDNIECMGDHWICWLEEDFEGNWILYIGEGAESSTGAEIYW